MAGRALRLDIAEDRPRPPRQRRDFGAPSDRGPRNDPGRNDPGRADPGRDEYGRDDFARDNFDRGDYDREGDGYGGGGGRSFEKPKRPKGSRRGLRGKKRSL